MRIRKQLQYILFFFLINVICVIAAAIGQAIHDLIPLVIGCLWFLAASAVILGKGIPLMIQDEKEQLEVLKRSRKK